MERLGARAERVVDAAVAEARRMGHPYVGTEHLLLGLLTVEGPARDALRRSGATADAARAKVLEAVGNPDQGPSRGGFRPRQPVSVGPPDFSDRARRALERASRLSLHRRDPDVEPEHVLIGVLDVEGRAGQVLRGLGVDIAALRRDAEVRVGEEFDADPEPPPPPLPPLNMAVPRCGHCSAALDEVPLAFMHVQALDDDDQLRGFSVAYCSVCGAIFSATPTV